MWIKKNVIEWSVWSSFLDWALPIRINIETNNNALEIQVLCFSFAIWRRDIYEIDNSNWRMERLETGRTGPSRVCCNQRQSFIP